MSLPALTPTQQRELDEHTMVRLAHFENKRGNAARGLWLDRGWEGELSIVVVNYKESQMGRGILANAGERKFDNYDKALAYAEEIENA